MDWILEYVFRLWINWVLAESPIDLNFCYAILQVSFNYFACITFCYDYVSMKSIHLFVVGIVVPDLPHEYRDPSVKF